MRTPIEVIEKLRDNELSQEWVNKLYSEEEFTFTICIGNNSKDFSYTKKIDELSEQEIKFLMGNWLDKFDTRPKLEGTTNK